LRHQARGEAHHGELKGFTQPALRDDVIDLSASRRIGWDVCPSDIRNPEAVLVLNRNAKVQELVRLEAGR
jgi:hypothetical protein